MGELVPGQGYRVSDRVHWPQQEARRVRQAQSAQYIRQSANRIQQDQIWSVSTTHTLIVNNFVWRAQCLSIQAEQSRREWEHVAGLLDPTQRGTGSQCGARRGAVQARGEEVVEWTTPARLELLQILHCRRGPRIRVRGTAIVRRRAQIVRRPWGLSAE